MAQLRPLGVPFGAPSQLINIPAPAGVAQGLLAQQQAFQSAGSSIANAIVQRSQNQALQQFAQQQGLNIPQGLNPQIVAQLLGQTIQAGQQPGFTLSPGQQRFTGGGQQVATAPPAPAPPRAGALQVATQGDPSGLTPGTVFQADPSGNVKIIREAGSGALSASEKAKLAVTQGAAFRADSRIANLRIIEQSERGMRAALKQATSPNVKSRIASDQALGVLFQKMLDPPSVVRESEFARTPEGAAALNRLLAIGPQLRLGGLRLLDEDRQALVSMAQLLLEGGKESANQAFSEFSVSAQELGLNEKIIFGGAKPFNIGGTSGVALSPTLEAELAALAEKGPPANTIPSRDLLLR